MHAPAIGADAGHTVAIPDAGWRLWPDTTAKWKDDTLYLPGEFDLAKLPVNPPTGGWQVLDAPKTGIPVTLPSTVEQHFWGKMGLRPYQGSEYYFGKDKEPQNGAYQGVSWWWCNVDVPASFAGKTVLLHIRGMRQRAEIFVNQKVVGYDIIGETSFDCDISKALKPGAKNQIAIRITNHGGRYDWLDSGTARWGQYSIPHSHGFGGLDRGLTLTAHDPVYLSDSWVLNTPKPGVVTAHATVRNTTAQPQAGALRFSIIDPQSNKVVAQQDVAATVPAGKDQDFQTPLVWDKARIWSLETPNLYQMKVQWAGPKGSSRDEDEKDFGFRWFAPAGIGKEAGLYLNGQRVRLYTAISWGFWGLNGLWPTAELAEREVRDARRFGMNMLNFHRDIGKEEVFEQQDKLGLLRYMEPGAGMTAIGPVPGGSKVDPSAPIDTSGNGGEPKDFTQKYEETKILRMIKQFRSHPSLVIYVVQNEMDPVLARQPRVFNLLKKMHDLDPSRVIALKSGIPVAQQAWYAPYEDAVRHDDGTGYSGWRDQHTVGGPGVWKDEFYQDPTNFTHVIDNRKEIVDWGEMLGAAVADNHPLMIRQIMERGGSSYDLKDHLEIAEGTRKFLDKWGFRKTFPTDEAFFKAVGDKCYEFWGKVLETARLSESNDILTISGWESTAIENHSGLVDNLRNFKGDPELIAAKLALVLPVAKPRGLIHTLGETVTVDLYLLNESGRATTGSLHLSLTTPSGKAVDLGTFTAPPYVADKFVYPIKMGVNLPALTEQGAYKLSFIQDGNPPARNSETIMVYGERTDLKPAKIGVLGSRSGEIRNSLKSAPQLKIEDYKPGGKYDMVIATPSGNGQIVSQNDGSPITGTDDDTLFRSSMHGSGNGLRFRFDGLPAGPAKVSLSFCELEEGAPEKRLFDISINGAVVAKDFDIFKEAGGKNVALTRTFTVDPKGGVIDISVPRVAKKEALINAIKIEAGGRVIAISCGGETFTDKQGVAWKPYAETTVFPKELIQQVRQGLPLLVLAGREAEGDTAARQLAGEGAFEYAGPAARSFASWMGSWLFVRKHALYDGLPTEEVLKADYQIAVENSYGLRVDGPNVEVIAGYGHDHNRNMGASTFVTRLGKGRVVFQTLPLRDSDAPTIIRTRWLQNAIAWMTSGK
ncbi:MAG TPA: malectin domain-containing carbohydrate-binding protein [Chthoniobacterales bacterium]|nr:malectin domain-containing carbohydrate-binding protein [Chthoniobacterales bacterium]